MELAESLGEQKRFVEAEPFALAAVNVLDQLWEPKAGSEAQQSTGRLFLKALTLAARTLAGQGKTTEAEAIFKRALTVDDAVVASLESHHELVTSYADMLKRIGRTDDAKELLKRSRHTDSSLTPGEARAAMTVSPWKTLNEEAYSALKGGNYANAERLFSQAVKRARGAENDSEKLAESLLGLSSVYDAQGRYSEALPLAEDALKMARAHLGSRDKKLAPFVTRLASVHAHISSFEKSTALYEEALVLRYASTSPRWSPDTRRVMDSLSDVYTKSRKYDKAVKLLREKLEYERERYGSDSIKILMTSIQIAETLRAAGKIKEAEATYKFVAEKDAVVRKLDPRDLIKAQQAHAEVLRKLGRVREAEKAEAEAKTLKDELLDDFGGR